MCTQDEIDKIDSGKYIVVHSWEHYIKLWSPLIFFIGAIIYTTIWMKDVEATTFPNSEVRNGMIKWYNEYEANGYTFNQSERNGILDHVDNKHLDHMPIAIKDERYMLRKEYVLIEKQLTRIENAVIELQKK